MNVQAMRRSKVWSVGTYLMRKLGDATIIWSVSLILVVTIKAWQQHDRSLIDWMIANVAIIWLLIIALDGVPGLFRLVRRRWEARSDV